MYWVPTSRVVPECVWVAAAAADDDDAVIVIGFEVDADTGTIVEAKCEDVGTSLLLAVDDREAA